MKRLLVLFCFGLCLLVFNQSLIGQSWDKAQEEVWNHVKSVWNDFENNPDAFANHFHDEYVGWSLEDNFPNYKADVEAFISMMQESGASMSYKIHPMAVQVFKDVAIVHYLYEMYITDGEGKTETNSGRWTDVYQKDGGKWLLIGDSGGEMEDD